MPPRLKSPVPIEHQVHAWRKHRKMTLQQVADAIGSHKGHISRIESHHTALVQPTAEAIAKVFGIDAETLRTRKPDAVADLESDLLALFRGLSDKAKEAALTSVRAIAALDRKD